MGGLFGFGGGSTISTSEPRVGTLRMQQSVYGAVLPIVFGCQRVAPSLIWYGDFTPIAHTTVQTSGGKGGGGVTQSNTTYTYQTALCMALCEGQIAGVGAAWKAKQKYASLADAGGMSLFAGSMSQSPWSYLASAHPDQAVAYPGMAYLAHGSYQLGSNPALDNHTFEVLGPHQFGGGVVDCDPKDVFLELLTNTQFGAGFPSAKIADLAGFSDYCVASGLFVSPALTQQKPAHEWLSAMADALNCAITTADGLRVIPYADAAVTAHGRTWTPDLTPAYDLTDDDFLDKANPILVRQKPKTDSFNCVSVEYTDRANDYNLSVVEAKDQGDIGRFGLRKDSPVAAHYLCDAATAVQVAQTLLQRKLHIRNEYEFRLGWNYVRLLPMSVVTLTDSGLGLNRFPVRAIQITEDFDGELTVIAEEMPVGAASPAMYSNQSGAGYSGNQAVAPGAVNAPLIFEPPTALASAPNEIWAAVSGGANWGGCSVWVSLDGSTYQRIGQIVGAARHGSLSATLGAPVADPDIANTVAVSLAADGQILPASQADADAYASLCWVDGEMLAYRDATLTGVRQYSLGYLHRGLYGTQAGAHIAGAQFARIDRALFRYSSPTLMVGQTLHLKFTSFNAFGHAEESLADVAAYTHLVTGGLNSGSKALNDFWWYYTL